MTNNHAQKVLEKFGLAENEAKVYQQILKDGETSPFRLARETDIPRTTVYELITGLALKGLIELEKSDGLMKQQTKIKSKNPSVLRQIIREKQKALSNLEVDVVDILPQLKADYHKDEANADFVFYPGSEGAKKVILSEDDGVDLPIYVLDYQTPMDAFGKTLINQWASEQIAAKKKYIPKELFPLNEWSRHVTTYQYGRDKSYIRNREFRYIENPIFEMKQRIAIKGNVIRISSIEEGESWGLVITSSTLVKTFYSIFQILWLQAIPVTDEVVKSWGENEFLKAEKSKK